MVFGLDAGDDRLHELLARRMPEPLAFLLRPPTFLILKIYAPHLFAAASPVLSDDHEAIGLHGGRATPLYLQLIYSGLGLYDRGL